MPSGQELRRLKQGFMRIENFMNTFVSLKQQGNVLNDFSYTLLEWALCPNFLHKSLLTKSDISDWNIFSQISLEVRRSLEELCIIRDGQAPGFNNSAGGSCFSASGTQPSVGKLMRIGTTPWQQWGQGPQCNNYKHFGHIACTCWNNKIFQFFQLPLLDIEPSEVGLMLIVSLCIGMFQHIFLPLQIKLFASNHKIGFYNLLVSS